MNVINNKKQSMKMMYTLLMSATILACSGNKVNNDVAENEKDSIAVFDEDIADVIDEDAGEDDYDPYKPRVCSSDDGVVTIESAMFPGSGSAPDYWARWKFKNKNGKACEVYIAESPYVTRIHSIKKDDGSTYYIVNCFARASSSDGYRWLEAYRIVGDTIREVSVIDGGKNTDNDDFSINYCIPNWYDVAKSKGYDWIFEYDPETRNLYVPIVIGESSFDLQLNDRYRVWHFNGKRFVDMGEKPHKDLHPSLANYNQLVKYFETKDYIVRVDSLDSHELRYASWKKPKTMKDKPDLVIKGGFKKEHHVAFDQLPLCDDYRFTNDGYEYIVNYCETKDINDEYREHNDFLLIRKNGKILFKQKGIMDD